MKISQNVVLLCRCYNVSTWVETEKQQILQRCLEQSLAATWLSVARRDVDSEMKWGEMSQQLFMLTICWPETNMLSGCWIQLLITNFHGCVQVLTALRETSHKSSGILTHTHTHNAGKPLPKIRLMWPQKCCECCIARGKMNFEIQLFNIFQVHSVSEKVWMRGPLENVTYI